MSAYYAGQAVPESERVLVSDRSRLAAIEPVLAAGLASLPEPVAWASAEFRRISADAARYVLSQGGDAIQRVVLGSDVPAAFDACPANEF